MIKFVSCGNITSTDIDGESIGLSVGDLRDGVDLLFGNCADDMDVKSLEVDFYGNTQIIPESRQ